MIYNDNKKILLLIDSLKAIGGAEQMFIDQANYFAEKGIEVYAASVLSGRSNHFRKNLSPRVHFTEFQFGSFFDFKQYLKLSKYLKHNDIKLIYSFIDFSNFIARIGKIIYPRVKVVIIEPGDPNRRTKIMLFFDWIFNFLVYKIFAVSDDVKARLVAKFPVHKNKIVSVRNGVPPILSNKEVEEKLSKIQNSFFNILHIGNMKTENKGHKGIILSIAKVHRDRPDITLRLNLAGDGGMRLEFEKLVEAEGLKDIVIFLGAVPHEEIKKYCFDADIFIFNSRTEGGSAVIMEAASAALPTVTSDFNSVNEVVVEAKTGFIVNRDNIKQFAISLERLYDNLPLRIKLARNARALYEQKFTFKIWADFFIKELFN